MISTVWFTARASRHRALRRADGGGRGWWAEARRRGGWCPSVAVCLCAVNLAPACYIYVSSSPPPLSSTVTADLQHEADTELLTLVRSRFDNNTVTFLQQIRLQKVLIQNSGSWELNVECGHV